MAINDRTLQHYKGETKGSHDQYLNIGWGNIPGYRRVTALGNNPDIDTAPADVWTGLGTYPWMTGATALEIVSSSVNDAAAGTGARTVLINGLDINYVEVAQVVTLNGTTAVAISTSLFRIQSALIMSAGSGKVNAGILTIRDAGAGTTRAIIPLGYGITRQSQFTVPAGYTLQIISHVFSINRPSAARDVAVATFVQSPNGFYRMPLELSVDGQPYRHDGIPGIMVPEKTDYGIRCTYTSATNTELTAAWLGIMKLNTTE
jgi:hypothetical protein